MKRFIFSSTECRVNTMLRYFGEQPSAPCGTCDVCRDRRRQAPSRQDIDRITQSILYLAAQPGGHTIDHIAAQLSLTPQTLIPYLRTLMDQNRISITGTTVTTLPHQ